MEKKKIKFINIILCGLITLSTNFFTSVKAIEVSTDLSEVYETAESNEIISNNFSASLTDEDGSTIDLPVYEVIPDVSVCSDDETYTSTCIVGISNNLINNNSGIQTCGTITKEDDDGTYVYATLKITYSKKNKTSTAPASYLLTKVSGSWQVKSNQISLSNRRVAYTCQSLFSKATIKNLSSNSFSYNTGYSTYVYDAVGAVVGAQMNVTVKRGTGKWTFNLYNHVVDQVPGLGSLI